MYLETYIKETVTALRRLHPDKSEDEITNFVSGFVKARVKSPSIVIENTLLSNEKTTTDLLKFMTNIERNKPIVGGNATFFVQPEEITSPTSTMLKKLKNQRLQIKKELFSLNKSDERYRLLDLAQLMVKIIMNAEYGASAAPSAAFYNPYTPASTTLAAQSLITTMAAFFEGFIGNNQKFFHVNEFMDWFNHVIKQKRNIKPIRHITKEELLNRILERFDSINDIDLNFVTEFINTLSDDEVAQVFYVNNLYDFINDDEKSRKLLYEIYQTLPNYEASEKDYPPEYKSLKEYNDWVSSVMFLNPYEIPESIRKYFDELYSRIRKYCFIRYLTPDSIVKLNYRKRKGILLVDTDSNVINMNLFVSFVMNQIFKGGSFGRTSLYNDMISVNLISAILDGLVIEMIDHYANSRNINEKDRKELIMKNEFMFRRLFLTQTKKRYVYTMALREGNIMLPMEIDIKGLDFIKSSYSSTVGVRFKKILENDIMKTDKIDVKTVMRSLRKFDKEVSTSLKNGEIEYLKTASFKGMNAYKNEEMAWRLPVYRGVLLWNTLNPSHKIYALNKVKLIKLIVTDSASLDIIKNDFPDEHKAIISKIFNSDNPYVLKSGMKVICIPEDYDNIPEWILPLMDVDAMTSDIMSSFKSVMDSMRTKYVTVKTPHNKPNLNTSLIMF